MKDGMNYDLINFEKFSKISYLINNTKTVV